MDDVTLHQGISSAASVVIYFWEMSTIYMTALNYLIVKVLKY